MSGFETIRLSSEAKARLSTLKTKTGIYQWNILCRWAFCLSLSEEDPPADTEIPADSNVEMTWRTFAGAGDEELYRALLRAYYIRKGIAVSEEDLAVLFRRHLHRGIYRLASMRIKDVSDLLGLARAASDFDKNQD